MTTRPGRIRWLAVMAGFFVDILLSEIIRGIGSQFDAAVLEGATFRSATTSIVAVLLVLSTGIGGWVAGRMARHEHVLHGVLVGGVGIFLILLAGLGDAPEPFTNVVLQCFAVLAGGLGGFLSRWIPAPQEQ
ncbi:MAG TPA: TIGR04086 family membrane protein [Herpetosiphonaceae bacterium]|nr:TIGR04086 family membrane protein [Herpetosiphonaceae bacterium]